MWEWIDYHISKLVRKQVSAFNIWGTFTVNNDGMCYINLSTMSTEFSTFLVNLTFYTVIPTIGTVSYCGLIIYYNDTVFTWRFI